MIHATAEVPDQSVIGDGTIGFLGPGVILTNDRLVRDECMARYGAAAGLQDCGGA